MTSQNNWQTICHKNDLVKHSGVCALLGDNKQIAIFQTSNEQAFAISNWDPAGKANVLYRGLIGDTNGEIYVASPLYKERYSLSSGQCLDDETLNVQSYQTRIVNDEVQILA